MRILLIVNSTASSVTTQTRVVITKALSADHQVEVAATTRRGNAARLAEDAAGQGVDVVAVLAGDGTLNEAASALVGTNCALAALPGGSTNVYCRTLGFDNEPIEATAQLINGLARDHIQQISTGAVNGRQFLFHTGIGFDAAVVDRVERRPDLKRYLGHTWFGACAIRTGISGYERRRPTMRVVVDNETEVEAGELVIMASNPYTYVGSRAASFAPDVDFSKGLTVLALSDLTVRGIIQVLGRGLRGKNIDGYRGAHRIDGVTRVAVTSLVSELPHQVDGDFLGSCRELEILHQPNALRVALPG